MMAFSGILKLKFGPFWFKNSILLVNVMPFGHHSATYVLRVERPSVCGGRVDLPIGRSGYPIDLLPRSAKDRRKLQFAIRYGPKGKKLRFLAPTTGVYGHWITVLREAFGGSVKVAKREPNETASTVNENSNTDIQETLVTSDNDSMCGERSSEEIDTVASTSASCPQHKSIACTDTDICDNNCSINGGLQEISTCNATPGPSLASVSKNQASIVVDERGGVVIDAYSNTTSSGEQTPLHTPQVNQESTLPRQSTTPTDGNVSPGCQNVYCMATDRRGITIFSVYVSPSKARFGHAAPSGKVFKLPPEQWARWMARDIRDGELLPDAFRLTSSSCRRLQLREMLKIAQPFFM